MAMARHDEVGPVVGGGAPPPLSATQLALLDHLSETVLLVDAGGEVVARLGPRTGLLGFVADDRAAPAHVAERVHPDDLLRVLELIDRARATPGMVDSLRVRARHDDGSWRALQVTVHEATADDRLQGAVVRIRAVTERPDAGVDPGDRFRSLADAVPSGILTADAGGSVVFSNEAARQILDLPSSALLGRGWETIVHAEDVADVRTASGAVLTSSMGEQVAFRVQTRSGERWVQARFLPLHPDEGSSADAGGDARRSVGWIAALEDITERRRMESRLAHRATHDPLTGLPNRALLDDRLQQACARLRRGGDQTAVLFCDLDGFKEINDRFDHTTGDEVLIEVARRLRHVLRPADTVARLGGDEFVVVCEGTSPEAAAEVAGRIVDVLAVPFLVARGRVSVRASIGIACTDDPEIEPSDLLLRADRAMYHQKHGEPGEGGMGGLRSV